eukprot:gene14907-biopygen12204
MIWADSSRFDTAIRPLWSLAGAKTRPQWYTFQASDSAAERRRKETFIPVELALAVIALPFAVHKLLMPTNVSVVGTIMSCLAVAAQGVTPLALRRYPLALLEAGNVAAAAGVLLLDWHAASRLGNARWPACVVVLDALLVADARDWAARCVIALVLGWLVVERAERGVRYGLYDAAYRNGSHTIARVLRTGIRAPETACASAYGEQLHLGDRECT